MMKAPFQGFPPELLAQIAQGAFRPPQGMGGMQAPGMQAPQMGGGGDGGLGAGMQGLGMGLANWKRGGGINPNGMPEDGSFGSAVAGINAIQPGANGQFAPPPMPTDIGYGQGGGGSFGNWLRGLF
jgi:hypothetical protein